MVKSDEIPGWAPVLGAAIVCLLIFSFALVAAGGWAWFSKFLESAAPSWLQAIGALLAIYATGHFARVQAARAREEAAQARRKADTEKALAIHFILRRVDLVVDNAERALASNTTGTIVSAGLQIDMMQSALRALPVFEIPSPRLVFDLQRVDRDLLYVARLIEEEAIPRTDRKRRTGKALFVRVKRRVAAAKFACVKCIDPIEAREIPLTGLDLYDDEPASDEAGLTERVSA